MTALNKRAELRKELSNPAIGSNHHLRKLALSLLDELETSQTERDEFRSRLKLERAILADAEKRIAELEAAERQNGFLREQRDEWERKAISNFEECAEMSTRIEELESQRKLAFTASNRWADKFREAKKRNAELTEFIQHIKKCLVKNGEYAPLSHEEIDTLLGIRADGIRAAGIGVKGE